MTRPQFILSFQHQRFQLVNTKAKMKETNRERGQKRTEGKQRRNGISLVPLHGAMAPLAEQLNQTNSLI
jgi:hypothetical protein